MAATVIVLHVTRELYGWFKSAPFYPESRIALTLDNMPDTVSELDTLVVPGDSGLCQSVVGKAIAN